MNVLFIFTQLWFRDNLRTFRLKRLMLHLFSVYDLKVKVYNLALWAYLRKSYI